MRTISAVAFMQWLAMESAGSVIAIFCNFRNAPAGARANVMGFRWLIIHMFIETKFSLPLLLIGNKGEF